MKKPEYLEYFEWYDLVPPSMEFEVNWENWDVRILKALQKLRVDFGPCYINNWYIGGNRKWSGYRPPDCTIGAKQSMHKQWKALDIIFFKRDVESVRNEILKNLQKEYKDLIKRVELNVNWLHIDTKETGKDGIIGFEG